MTDDLERLRRLRPDRLQSHDPMDPEVLREEKERLMSAIAQPASAAEPERRMGLEDMFWGDRRYEALDPDGHRWHFGERMADIRRRGGRPQEGA